MGHLVQMAITWFRLVITDSIYLPTQCAAQIYGYLVEIYFLFDVKSENEGLAPHIFNEFVWKRMTGQAEMSE